jgi:S1-C subfamily serine protease
MKPAKPLRTHLLALWLAGLTALLLGVAVVANYSIGQSAIQAEAEEHWRPAGVAGPPVRAGQAAGTNPYSAAIESSYNTIAKALDAVTVSVTAQSARQNKGSGFYVDQGYVLTNFHVVQQAGSITVTTYGPTPHDAPALVAAQDPDNDMALLRVQSAAANPVARLGDSDSVRVGDTVFALGNMLGLGNTFTAGLVSDRRNDLVIDGRSYRGLLQVNTTINHGSSGGPLANLAGEVIGVNTAIHAPGGAFSGIAFAMPINRARPLIHSIRSAASGAVQAYQLAAAAVLPEVTFVGQPAPPQAQPQQATLLCHTCGTARYARCPVCQERMVLDAAGTTLVCPARHGVTADTRCPRCGRAMATQSRATPYSLAV